MNHVKHVFFLAVLGSEGRADARWRTLAGMLDGIVCGERMLVEMVNVITGAVEGNGFGPFDSEKAVGLTEYGGGAGLVEGAPKSQSATGVISGRFGVTHTGPGADHVADIASTLSVDEKLGVTYRASRASQEDPGFVDPSTGEVVSAAGQGAAIDPETGLSVDDVNV